MKTFFFPTFNGACAYSNGRVVTAIVNSKGNKRVEANKTSLKIIPCNIFFFRGLEYFFFGIIAQLSAFSRAEKLQVKMRQEEGVIGKISERLNIATKYVRLFTALVLGLLIGFLVFDVLVKLLVSLICEKGGYLFGFLVGLFRVIIYYLIMLALKFLPVMQELYRFNGACNKMSSSSTKITDFSKNSPYFALNFLNFIIFTLIISTFVISLVQISVGFVVDLLTNFSITVFCIGISFELLLAIDTLKKRWLYDFILPTSCLVVSKPGLTEEETVRITLIEGGFNQEGKVEEEKIPMSAVISEMQTKLFTADRYAQSDVEWIIATVLNKNRAETKLVRALSTKEYREIMRATERRAKGEPLSSIFGYVDFYGLRLDVNKKVLSPRMETEILVEQALKLAKNFKNPVICDLCTGSGAIAIAIKKNLDAKVYAIDISKPALLTAEANAKKHDVKIEFVHSNLFNNIKRNKRFDIIVSNPPYICSGDCDKLPIEVKRYDPILALDGGEDGLDFYRQIVSEAPDRLNKDGILMFEVGKGQAEKVRALMKNAGFIDTHVIKDYNNIERIVYGKRK